MRISDWSSDVCSSDLVRLRRRVQEVLNHLLELWVLGWVVFVTLDHQCSTLPRTSRLIREIAAASSRRYTGTVVSRFAARRRRSCETELSFSRSRSEEHTSELQSLMRISYAVFCLKKKKKNN